MSLDSILRSVGKNLFDKTIPYSNYAADSETQYGTLRFYVGVGTPVTISFTAPTETFTSKYMFVTFSHLAKSEQVAITKYQWLILNNEVVKTIWTNTSVDGYFSLAMTESTYNLFINNNIQIEIGSTATTYEPYHQGPKSVKIGDKEVLKVSYGSRNLFDISSSVGFQSYYSGVTNTISGTTITTSSTANRGCNLLLGDFPVGTYTISFSNTDFALLMLQYGEALGQLSRLDNVDFVSSKSHTFTLTQPRKLWLESTISTNQTRTITDIQYELGDKATKYVPYSKEVVWINPIFNSTLGNFILSKSILL